MSASPSRRFLSLWLPFLPTDRVRRQRGPLLLDAHAPLVLASKTEGTQRLMAADRLAQARGLRPGMALAQARAMVPDLRALPYEAAADVRLLESIADWADRYTPLVGRDHLLGVAQGLMLDITGAAHLLGGEAALSADLVGRLGRQGVHAVAAIAPTVGAAWALARCGDPEGMILPEDVSRGGLDAALARLPVQALRLAPETSAALRRVGLKHIGDLIGRPRSALAARFGAALILQLDRARGIDTEAINPRQPIPPAVVEQGFAEPILTTGAVEQSCRALAERLTAVLEDRGQGATALELAVYRVDGLAKRIDLRLASPSRDAKTMADLMALRLGHLDDPLDPGFGYDLVRLAATAIAAKGAEARALPGLDDLAAPQSLAEACAPLIDRLAARFGADAIQTLATADTHIPEQAARLVPASITPALRTEKGPPPAADPRHRPLRLFDPPEPVEVMAEVPDGPPVHLRWRRRPLRIVTAQGPERIAPEWWRPAALAQDGSPGAGRDCTRDYWRIEDAAGRRLWLYREGFYGGPGAAATQRLPRWYVHGLFA